jgi:hypothetical protein
MANHQNLEVIFLLPGGNRLKQHATTVGGPIGDEAKLREYLLRPHPKGTTIQSVVRLDAEGKPVPGHPIAGAFREDEGEPIEVGEPTPAPEPVVITPVAPP